MGVAILPVNVTLSTETFYETSEVQYYQYHMSPSFL